MTYKRQLVNIEITKKKKKTLIYAVKISMRKDELAIYLAKTTL